MKNCKCPPPVKEDPCWTSPCACPEDHTHTTVNYNYTVSIVCLTPFNMPRVGDTLELSFDNVVDLLPEATLWNSNVGYLHITSFDSSTNIATVTNKDEYGNKAVGAAVLANEKFIVTAPTPDISNYVANLDSAYLSADFISPAIGECQIVSVSSISGLAINDTISIQGYLYRISTIIDKNTITLCNTGNGASSGHVINYDPNSCGNGTVPVIVYQRDPCESTVIPVQTGKVLVCHNGETVPIIGDSDGQILSWNNPNKRWELFNANLAEECTILTTCLIIDPASATSVDELLFLATVGKTSIFAIENKILIADVKYVIVEIVSDTQMRVRPETLPTEITYYSAGESVCLENCCAWVPQKLTDTIDSSSWRPASLDSISYWGYDSTVITNTSGSDLQVLADVDDAVTVNSASSITIANSNPNAALSVYIRWYSFCRGRVPKKDNVTFSDKSSIQLASTLNYTIAGTTETVVATLRDSYSGSTTGTNPHDLALSEEVFVELPAYTEDNPTSSTITISGSTVVTLLSNSTMSYGWGSTESTGSIGIKIMVEAVRQ